MTPQQLYERAQQCHRTGDYPEAERLYREVARLTGGYAGVLVRLGEVCFRQNKFKEAAEAFGQAIRIAPGNAAALAGLGCTLNALGRPGEALPYVDRALALAPDRIEFQLDRGIALSALGRAGEAATAFGIFLEHYPDHRSALMALSATLQDLEEHEAALVHLQSALRLSPSDPSAQIALSRSLSALGRRGEAMALLEAVAAVHPALPETYSEMGTAWQRWGRFADASRCFAQAIALKPDAAAVLYAWVASERITTDHPAWTALEKVEPAGLNSSERVHLHFAKAKACDDLGRRDEAISHWLAAHRIQSRLTPYDGAEEIGLLQRIAQRFTAEFLLRSRGAGDPSECPIFIVGMARSGTTLVEQILASHPDVFGAGEVGELGRLYDGLNAGGRDLTHAELASIGGRYLEAMRRRAPDARRVTNKMPGNFAAIGLIAAALPKAKIIHVRRNPLDTCFSCWTTLFATGHRYTHDLADLGHYYRAYEDLMSHWREVLPANAVIEVTYEDLVADFAPEARRIVEACGLSWDDACLDFHRTERPIETASSFQVRQPLYRSAIGRAAAYARHLEPLRKALGGRS
jgi:tetratricopeptide (TPR) repeat protein